MQRITEHPIVADTREPELSFRFGGRELHAKEGEVISSALIAHGIRIFGHHPKDGAPQGIYCANGQCSQCLLLADGRPVKACMTPVRAGMCVEPLDGLPQLPLPAVDIPARLERASIDEVRIPVLILGGGPAGLSAAIELGNHGVDVLIVDDKDRLGGKLVLQTHRFFGSTHAVYAGTRGIEIARRLGDDVASRSTIRVWTGSTALAVFSDRRVGVLRGSRYTLIEPDVLLVATGARERSLLFPGNTLPGVYGAGAFQTLVNRDLVRAAQRLFIVGGGNVGLIAGYHALQAGIDVIGLAEALPECGGYKVHRDKLARMGVPIHTSHTVLSANGAEAVESVTIARLDESFRPIEGSAQTFSCDTLLVAVGLDPVDEFLQAGRAAGLATFAAGDAEDIAEASAAIFAGRIRGLEIARHLGATIDSVPETWHEMERRLKSRPGRTHERSTPTGAPGTVYPVFHCSQEIPCNPCTSACPQRLIRVEGDGLLGIPAYVPEPPEKACVGCERCVTICPGLAITLVDRRGDQPIVTIPFEFEGGRLSEGQDVTVVDVRGTPLTTAPILECKEVPANDRTRLIKLRVSDELADRVSGIRVQASWIGDPLPDIRRPIDDAEIICRCERVTAAEIRSLIRSGLRDLNEIKTITRAGMGACGGKTCTSLIHRLFREEGIAEEELTDVVHRPLFIETPLGSLAGLDRASEERS